MVYATSLTAPIRSCAAFESYNGGIFSKIDCDTSDHSVHLIGYSSSSYWIIKNSWGTGWGESGFAKVLIKTTDFGTTSKTIASGGYLNIQTGPFYSAEFATSVDEITVAKIDTPASASANGGDFNCPSALHFPSTTISKVA